MTSTTSTVAVPTIRRRRWRIIGACVAVLLAITVLLWHVTRNDFADEVRTMGGSYDSRMAYDPINAVFQLLNRQPLLTIHRIKLTGPRFNDRWLQAHRQEFESLSYLDLSLRDTGVTDDGLQALRNLEGVHSLDLAGTAVTDASLGHINTLPRLYGLTIAGTRIADQGLVQLSNSPSLQWLCIDVGQASPAGVDSLTNCPNLRYLTVVDADDDCAARLTRLRVLRLQGASLTVAGLLALQPMQQLESVILIDSHLTGEEISQLKTAFPRCTIFQTDHKTLDASEDAVWK